MDPIKSAQDVIRCDLCEDAIVQMYCDICQVKLCISCIGKHISDDYFKHKIVPFQEKKSTLIYPKCTTHQTKNCKFHCKECNISLCSMCSIISEIHKGHCLSTLLDVYNAKREVIVKDSDEIENIVSPTYEGVERDIENQIDNLDKEYETLTTTVTKRGEDCLRVINTIVDKMKVQIEEQKIRHIIILKEHLHEIKQKQLWIEETSLKLNLIKESNEMSLTMEYNSKIKEFRKLPPKVQVSLPTFSPKIINTDQFCKMFGLLTPLYITTEENGYKLKTSKSETLTRELLEKPELITNIKTGYENLLSVTCFGDEEIWTRANKDIALKCFNNHGSLLKKIKTKSGGNPNDIALTDDGDLVYADGKNGTVNKVRNGKIEEIIRLQDWTPSNICVTSSGDLLVTMFRDDRTQSKVVRYSGSVEKQTIQFDNDGRPLYSENNRIKYITENNNNDICVADSKGHAVVVVNQTGKLRFRYTGHHSTPNNKPFEPLGIATDSQSQILIADFVNNCIHILDQDGQFLHSIDKCNLKGPHGIHVDKRDNLLVAEFHSGAVKKIKYMK